MSGRPSLSVSATGVGTVYVSLPLGGYQAEREMLLGLLATHRTGVIPTPPDVYFLTGQADLAARFQVEDFRGILGLGYPADQALSAASVYNWVFSVCYQLPPADILSVLDAGEDRPGAIAPVAVTASSAESKLHFIVHLRVLRSFYAVDPIEAETRLVQHLKGMFATLELSIETGVGWSDLILNGDVDASRFAELLNILIRVNILRAGNGTDPAMPLFTRTLTLFGHPWNGNLNSAPIVDSGFRALMFVRSQPGELDKVRATLKRHFAKSEIFIVDGKLDLVAILNEPSAEFFANHVALVECDGDSPISKLETHLLFGDGSDSPLNEKCPGTASDLRIDGLRLRECRCQQGFAEVRLSDNIPSRLKHAVRNLIYLMRVTLNDSTNCCDVRPAILACLGSLSLLQESLDEAVSLLTKIEGDAPLYYEADEKRNAWKATATSVTDRVVARLLSIERWVLLGERVLRQRTIGSFEEFLGQSDRAVFYRGGAQKMLFLADCLMNEFYRRVAPSIGRFAKAGVSLERDVSMFASVYDAVHRIESETSAGLVRVPAQNVFMLASVIPDLWHEVGTYCFFNCFDGAPKDFGLGGRNDAALYGELADHFGDVIVWIFGFDCRFRQFAISTINRFFDSIQDHLGLVRETLTAAVILRLMLVLDLINRCIYGESVRSGAVLSTVIAGIVEKYMPQRASQFTDAWDPAINARKDPVYAAVAEVLHSMAPLDKVRERFGAAPESMITPELSCTLPRFDVSDDLNEKMYQVHWAIERSRILDEKTLKAFGPMAAVGRSAVLEYHRRLAREDSTPAQTVFDEKISPHWLEDSPPEISPT